MIEKNSCPSGANILENRHHSLFGRLAVKAASALLLGLALVTTNGCDGFWFKAFQMPARADQVVRVVIAKGPFTYSLASKNSKQQIGLERELLQAWAADSGLQLKFDVVDTPDQVESALENSSADIGAARFRWPLRSDKIVQGPVYDEAQLSLYCQRKLKVEGVDDLRNRRVLVARWDRSSALEQQLSENGNRAKISSHQSFDADQMFEEVAYRKADCLITDSDSGNYFNQFHTSVDFVGNIQDPKSIFILGNSSSTDLLNSFKAWLQWSSHENKYLQIQEHYRGYLASLSYHDKLHLSAAIQEKLPALKKHFLEASKLSGLPWTLIAAVAYQESHWNSEARSYTGVRGMMQITEGTAAHLGISDRTDTRESVLGGGRYLAQLMKEFDADVRSKDRLALALVSYNIGLGHLRDLQEDLESNNQDPNSWHNIRSVLPEKTKSTANDKFEFGKARGFEAIQFVERVMGFYEILERRK